MAVIEFDLDEALSFFNFNFLSFEKTRNAPIVPILRGKGVSFAAENFTYNDYFELKFIIKKDLRYTINKFDQLTLDQKSPEKTETLSELEKIYKIYSLYRTKSLVFIKNKDLFNKLFPGIRKLKLQELKNVFINELSLLKKRCSEANNLQDTTLAKQALEKKLDQALEFFLNYAGEFKDYEEAKEYFGRSYKYTNNKTELIEGDYYLTEAMFDKVKNAKKKVEDLVKGSQENPPFLTMLNKFSIASVPDTADGFEVTLGLHYFDSIFSDVIIENYKKERKRKENGKDGKETDNAQQKFYDDITKTIREIFAKDKNELTLQVFNIDRTSFEGEFAPEERKKATGDEFYLDYNSAQTNIKFDYSQIAQFEIISYFQIAEVPIQGKSKPLKQNLGVANTTLSLRLIDKDTGADGLSKMMNEIQYLSELEQRKLRSNLKFPFLNALDMIGAELSDFHYSSDLESDGSISTIIFNCHGYEFKPDLQTQTLATQNINVPLTKDVIYYNLFNRYLRDVSYTSVSTIATTQERNKGWNELVLDSGNGDVYTMFDLAESYAVGSDKLGNEKTINDVFKAPEIFSDLYRFSDLFIEAKKITDFNVKNINFSQLSDYAKYGGEVLEKLVEAKNSTLKYDNEIKKIEKEISILNAEIKKNQKEANLLQSGKNDQQTYFYKCIDNAVNGNYISNTKLNVPFKYRDSVTDNIYISMLEEAFKPFYNFIFLEKKKDKSTFSEIKKILLFFANDKFPIGKNSVAVLILGFLREHILSNEKAKSFKDQNFFNYVFKKQKLDDLKNDFVDTFKNSTGKNIKDEALFGRVFKSLGTHKLESVIFDIKFFREDSLSITTFEVRIFSFFLSLLSSIDSFNSGSPRPDLKISKIVNSDKISELVKKNEELSKKIKKAQENKSTLLKKIEEVQKSESNLGNSNDVKEKEKIDSRWYENYLYFANSLFPTMLVEDEYANGNDEDILRNEFLKILMVKYFLSFNSYFEKIFIDGKLDGSSDRVFMQRIIIALNNFKEFANSDDVIDDAISIFEFNAEREEFFNKTGKINLKKRFVEIREALVRDLDLVLNSLVADLNKNATPYRSELFFTISNIQKLIKIHTLFSFSTYNSAPAFFLSYKKDSIVVSSFTELFLALFPNPYKRDTKESDNFEKNTNAVLFNDAFNSKIGNFDNASTIVLAFMAPAAIRFSFSSNYYGAYANEAAKKFVTPFEGAYAQLKNLRNNKEAELEAFFKQIASIFNGHVSLRDLFKQLITDINLVDLTLKDSNSYCGIKLDPDTDQPLKTLLKSLDFLSRSKNGSDLKTQLIAAVDSVNENVKTKFGIYDNEDMTADEVVQFQKDFYGTLNQENLYSSIFHEQEKNFYDTSEASKLAKNNSGFRVSMNGNNSVVKENFTKLFTHDLVDTMPTYSIFVIKNGKSLYSAAGFFEVQRIERFYGVDKISEISIQFSEETRMKTCFFNVIDDSTEYADFKIRTKSVLREEYDQTKLTNKERTLEIGDAICVYLGNVFDQKCVFNGTIHSISEGKYRQITCLNYANELALKSFNILRSEGEVGNGFREALYKFSEKFSQFFLKAKGKASIKNLAATKKAILNPNDHIIPNEVKCIVDPSNSTATEAVSFVVPSISNKDSDECSPYSLIFEGLAYSYNSMKHFKSLKELQTSLNFSEARSKNSFSGFWGLNERAGVSASTNLLRNINNVDRDLSYYGVEVVGYKSTIESEKNKEDTKELINAVVSD